jgi:hypothetical protein
VSKLSQAAAHPRRGTIITRNGFFLQGMTDMLHNKLRKSKGEKRVLIKDLHARNDATNSHTETPTTWILIQNSSAFL